MFVTNKKLYEISMMRFLKPDIERIICAKTFLLP